MFLRRRMTCKQDSLRLPEGFAIDPAPEGTYGIAIDLGTTTMVIMLWNLACGQLKGIAEVTNPQTAYGKDVISRAGFAMKDRESYCLLQKSLLDEICRVSDELLETWNLSREQVTRFAVAGNAVMTHLFLGMDVSKLAAAPFSPVFMDGIVTTGDAIPLRGFESAEVYVGPNLGGHVGSDVASGMMTIEWMGTEDSSLYIDVGTNGEMVLTANGKIFCCSAAAGPAFEGRGIHHGMGAGKGAIDRVKITKDGVDINVIGGGPPLGVCGSGILDAIGEMVRTGVADPTGRILSREELRVKGSFSSHLLEHIVEEGEINHFTLYSEETGQQNIRIIQKDVRQIQLAKAAISAGITMLMERIGIGEGDLEKIVMAGVFGSYLDVNQAMTIGLLPKINPEKVVPVGNAAGLGASMMLLSRSWRKKTEDTARGVIHLDLAASADFCQRYIESMSF